jgi:hypothetical protein
MSMKLTRPIFIFMAKYDADFTKVRTKGTQEQPTETARRATKYVESIKARHPVLPSENCKHVGPSTVSSAN